VIDFITDNHVEIRNRRRECRVIDIIRDNEIIIADTEEGSLLFDFKLTDTNYLLLILQVIIMFLKQ